MRAASAGPLGETFSLSLQREQMLALRRESASDGRALRRLPRNRRAAPRQGAFLQQRRRHQLGDQPDDRVRRLRATPWSRSSSTTRRAASASAPTLKAAWDKAFATDPDSPFGGIIITNRPWDLEFARAVDELFTEVLIGPDYPAEVLEFLRKKKNRRVMRFHPEAIDRDELDLKKVVGGLLVQTPDLSIEDPREGKVVTKRAPTDAEMRALELRHPGLQAHQVQRDRLRHRGSHAGGRRRRDLAHRSGVRGAREGGAAGSIAQRFGAGLRGAVSVPRRADARRPRRARPRSRSRAARCATTK